MSGTTGAGDRILTADAFGFHAQGFAQMRPRRAFVTVFILDGAGTVRYVWVSEDPGKEPDYEEVIRQLSQLVVR